MTRKTPAQAAYEAFQATRWPDSPAPGWEHPATGKSHAAWQAAAQAAISAWQADNAAAVLAEPDALDDLRAQS